MAEILCIVPRIGAGQAYNLGGSLKDLVARGVDPGPRGAQILRLGRTLRGSVRALREDLARLGLPKAVTGLDLDRLVRTAHLARSYDPPAGPTEA